MNELPAMLVTGASGFIGSSAVTFFGRNGWQVRAHGRQIIRGGQAWQNAAPPQGTAMISGNLESESAIESAIDGVDAVFHAAGLAHGRGSDRAELQRINVDWPETLAKVCLKHSIRFVHLSTSKVYGESGSFTEASDTSPVDDYAKAKAAAETAVRRANPAALIFRMPPVYGPGSKGSFRALVSAVRRGWPLPLGRIEAKRSYLYAGVLFEAAEFLLGRGESGIWNVTDDHDISLCDLVREIAQAMGRKAGLINVTPAVLRVLLAVRPGLYEKLAGTFTLDASRLKSAGFHTSVDFGTGLRDAVRSGNLL